MVIADWTFSANSIVTLEDANFPSSDSAPAIKINGPVAKRLFYPTNQTINGISTTGMTQGRVSYNTRHDFAGLNYFHFRSTDLVTSQAPDGYEVHIESNGVSTSEIKIGRRATPGGVFTTLQTINGLTNALPTPITGTDDDQWLRWRSSWWDTGANLTILLEVDLLDGVGYRPVNGAGVIDTAPINNISTCKVAFGTSEDSLSLMRILWDGFMGEAYP